MIKALLLDADGVTLKKLGYFSERIAKENNVPIEKIAPFYKNEFRLCQIGKADLKEELNKYLPDWKWDKGADAFIEYWFTTDAVSDEEVIAEMKKLKDRGINCFLATDQEKYRAQYLTNRLNFKDRFDGLFFSCDLGFKKSEQAFFEKVVERLGLDPGEIMYWDDDPENVDVAKAFGIDARLFTNLQEFKDMIHTEFK